MPGNVEGPTSLATNTCRPGGFKSYSMTLKHSWLAFILYTVPAVAQLS